jgi:hypothetical protein
MRTFILAAALLASAPALACPNMDHDEAPAPRTADKATAKKPASPAAPAAAKAKATEKKKPAADSAKAKEPPPADAKKPADKVS